MMLSGRRRIVSAGDVAIEDLSRLIYPCVCVTVPDMVGRLDIVATIERSAITLTILIMIRWITFIRPEGANLIVPEGKGARGKVTTIMSVGGEAPFTVAWRKLQCRVRGSIGIH